MRTNTETIAIIARHELRSALSNRFVPAFAIILVVIGAGTALAGLGASGQLLVQGFTRTSVSLLTVVLYLLPLFGMLLGASAFGDGEGGNELLLAQPITRWHALIARMLGLAAAIVLATAGGFAVTGLLVVLRAGTQGAGGYLLVFALATLAGLWGLLVGILIGVISRRRFSAIGCAVGAWIASAVIYDLLAIATLQLIGSGEPGHALVGLLAFNPIDGLRAVALVALGADVLLGPTGAALQRLVGPAGGAIWIAVSLLLWSVASMAIAARSFSRRDF